MMTMFVFCSVTIYFLVLDKPSDQEDPHLGFFFCFSTECQLFLNHAFFLFFLSFRRFFLLGRVELPCVTITASSWRSCASLTKFYNVDHFDRCEMLL